LSIYFQNVNRVRQQINELYLSVCSSDFDIIILLETNFNDDFFNEELFDSRYMVYRCDRSSLNSVKENGGGVIMDVKIKFKGDLMITVVNGDFVEQLWVKVIVGGTSLYVCSVYLPPNCDAVLI
jgi:exonuclease III